MMRILMGYNGSDAANAALHELRYAGFPDNTEAVVLTIAESWVRPSTPAETTLSPPQEKIRSAKLFQPGPLQPNPLSEHLLMYRLSSKDPSNILRIAID